MHGQLSQNATKKRNQSMKPDTKIMLMLTEILMQSHLITPEEKFRLTELLRKDHAV